MIYEWKYSMSVPAQKAGEELARLEKKHGKLTPKALLDESRDEKAVFHNLFEWDDTVAAEKYRLTQASLIIRNITVRVEDSEPVRAFVNVSKVADNETGQYMNVAVALRNEETKDFVLSQALAELRAFEKKYRALSELAGVLAEVQKLIA